MPLRPFIWTLALVWLVLLFRAESFLFSIFSSTASRLASLAVALTPLALLVDGFALVQWLTTWAVTLPWIPCQSLLHVIIKLVDYINRGFRYVFDAAEPFFITLRQRIRRVCSALDGEGPYHFGPPSGGD